MNKTPIVIGALILAPSLAIAQIVQERARVAEKTISAAASMTTKDGCYTFFINVNRAKDRNGSIHAYLSYSLFDDCYSVQGPNGNGEIPVSAVTGDGKDSLKLKINTATVKNFTTVGSPIKMNVSWKAIPGDFFNGKSSGITQVAEVRSTYRSAYGSQSAAVAGFTSIGTLSKVTAATVSWSNAKYLTTDTKAERSLAPDVQP